VELLEETKGGGKEGKKVNNNEIHQICVGTDTDTRKHAENC
jgi:hypothetical protein